MIFQTLLEELMPMIVVGGVFLFILIVLGKEKK